MLLITRSDARAAGKPRFYTGSACIKGHLSERYTNRGNCVECKSENAHDKHEKNPAPARARAKRRRDKSPDRLKAEKAAAYLANATEERAKRVALYRSNPYPARGRSRAWRLANPAKARSYNQAWHAANGDRARLGMTVWHINNPGKTSQYSRNRRARIIGAFGRHTIKDISWLKKQQNHRCAFSWCRARLLSGFHIDHIMPLILGGSNDKRNLQLTCKRCNLSKGAKHPIEFALQHGVLV